jgi:hypothetical protein
VLNASQGNEFILAELFIWWASEVLFPDIIGAPEKLHDSGHMVVILDGCTSRAVIIFWTNIYTEVSKSSFFPPIRVIRPNLWILGYSVLNG